MKLEKKLVKITKGKEMEKIIEIEWLTSQVGLAV